jgi:hypothetical protein
MSDQTSDRNERLKARTIKSYVDQSAKQRIKILNERKRQAQAWLRR